MDINTYHTLKESNGEFVIRQSPSHNGLFHFPVLGYNKKVTKFIKLESS